MTKYLIIALFIALFWVGIYRTEDTTAVPIVRAEQTVASVEAVHHTSTTTAILALTNRDRVTPLTESSLLMKAAQYRAEFFCDNEFSHYAGGLTPWNFFNAVGYDYRFAGENLAKDYAVPEQVEAAWLRSPKHRENIVNENYTEIGVGWACGITVVLFGKPQ